MAKTVRELTAASAPARTDLSIVQAPTGSTETLRATIAQLLALSLATDISNSSAIGRSILTAANAGIIVALLGISSDGGSDYGLVYDGVTDQTMDLNDLLDAALAGTTIRPISNNVEMYINSRVRVPSYITLDLSRLDVNYGPMGEISAFGSFAELPTTNLFRLRSSAAPSASTLQVDITPQGSMALLAVGAFGVIRGQNDGSGAAQQRHEFRITARSTTFGAETITIDPPMPTDEGTFLVSYPNGAYFDTFGVTDRTYISVKVGTDLTSNVTEGQDFVVMATTTGFARGDIVQVFDDYLASDIGGTSNNSIRDEVARVSRVTGTTLFFDAPIERDYTTARHAVVFKLDTIVDAHIIGARSVTLTSAPTASPASRKHWYLLAYAEHSTLERAIVDARQATFALRGQAGRMFHCINSEIKDCEYYGPADAATTGVSGDLYGFVDYYGTDNAITNCYTEHARHGRLAQGATRPTWRGGRSVNDLINGGDGHGLWTVGLTIDGLEVELGRDFASDSTTKSGFVVGNTSHYGGDHRTTIRNSNVVAPFGIAETRGITVRAGVTGLLVENCRFSRCEYGIDLQRNSAFPSLGLTDVELKNLQIEDCAARAVNISGNAPAWVTAHVYSAGSYVESSGNLYKTTLGGTSGVTLPSHGVGSASDGGVVWTYQSAELYPIVGVKLDGVTITRCDENVRTWRVDTLQLQGVRVSNPADTGNPAFDIRDTLDLVIKDSDATGVGAELLDCPDAIISSSNFYEMTGGGAWLTDLGGNDGTQVAWIVTRGSTTGIDAGGGSTITELP